MISIKIIIHMTHDKGAAGIFRPGSGLRGGAGQNVG